MEILRELYRTTQLVAFCAKRQNLNRLNLNYDVMVHVQKYLEDPKDYYNSVVVLGFPFEREKLACLWDKARLDFEAPLSLKYIRLPHIGNRKNVTVFYRKSWNFVGENLLTMDRYFLDSYLDDTYMDGKHSFCELWRLKIGLNMKHFTQKQIDKYSKRELYNRLMGNRLGYRKRVKPKFSFQSRFILYLQLMLELDTYNRHRRHKCWYFKNEKFALIRQALRYFDACIGRHRRKLAWIMLDSKTTMFNCICKMAVHDGTKLVRFHNFKHGIVYHYKYIRE